MISSSEDTLSLQHSSCLPSQHNNFISQACNHVLSNVNHAVPDQHKSKEFNFTSNENHRDEKNLSVNPITEKEDSNSVNLSIIEKNGEEKCAKNEDQIIGGVEETKKDVEEEKLSLLKIIFNIKLKMLARRILNQTKSRMLKNMTNAQFKMIDDKAWILQPINKLQQQQQAKKISQNNNNNSLQFNKKKANSMFRGSFFSRSGRRELTTEMKQQKRQKSQLDDEEQMLESSEKNLFLVDLFKSMIIGLSGKRFFRQMSELIPLIHPSSVFKILWDLVSMSLIAAFLIFIPLYVTFYDMLDGSLKQFMITLAPIYVFLDVLINLNSSYYEKGLLIRKRYSIILNYWKRYSAAEFIIFTVCIVHNMKVYQEQQNEWTRALLLVFILKIQRYSAIFRKFEEFFISRRSRQIMDLTKLLSVIMIIGHFISCFWIMLSQFEKEVLLENTWLDKRDIPKTVWQYQYIEAFYFTMVTMVTVGYGDVLPITALEKTVCVILMLVSCGIFAYSMNTIGNILENFNQEEMEIAQKMEVINTYMSKKNVNKQMQYGIREYLDYYWREASERDQEAEEKIILQLSDSLRENLLIEANKIVLKQSSIFRKNFSARIKQRIIPLIKEYRCTPEEIICNEGDIDDCSIFFIEKGSVQIFIEATESGQKVVQKQLLTLKKGQCFGEISFFTGQPRCASVRSKEFTTLLMIKRDNFLELLKDFNEDFEQFSAIKDSIGLYQDYSILDIKCYSCGSSQHLISHCPYIHFKCNSEKIIFLSNKSVDQERQAISTRRIKDKEHTIIKDGIEFHKQTILRCLAENIDHPNVLGDDNLLYSIAFQTPSENEEPQKEGEVDNKSHPHDDEIGIDKLNINSNCQQSDEIIENADNASSPFHFQKSPNMKFQQKASQYFFENDELRSSKQLGFQNIMTHQQKSLVCDPDDVGNFNQTNGSSNFQKSIKDSSNNSGNNYIRSITPLISKVPTMEEVKEEQDEDEDKRHFKFKNRNNSYIAERGGTPPKRPGTSIFLAASADLIPHGHNNRSKDESYLGVNAEQTASNLNILSESKAHMEKSAGTPSRELRGKWLGFEEQNSLNKSSNAAAGRSTIIPRQKKSTLLLDLNSWRNTRQVQNVKTSTVVNPMILSRGGEHRLSVLAGNSKNLASNSFRNNQNDSNKFLLEQILDLVGQMKSQMDSNDICNAPGMGMDKMLEASKQKIVRRRRGRALPSSFLALQRNISNNTSNSNNSPRRRNESLRDSLVKQLTPQKDSHSFQQHNSIPENNNTNATQMVANSCRDYEYFNEYDMESYYSGEFGDQIDGFEVMKNYEIYFPFNNLQYQLKLMGISREEKKRLVIQSRLKNQQTMKIFNDSGSTRIGIPLKTSQSKNSMQKVAAKYQKEVEMLENQNINDIKKLKFNTQSKFSQLELKIGQYGIHTAKKRHSSPSCKKKNPLEETGFPTTAKTLNLINLQKNSSVSSNQEIIPCDDKNENKAADNKLKENSNIRIDSLSNKKISSTQHDCEKCNDTKQDNVQNNDCKDSPDKQQISIELHSDIQRALYPSEFIPLEKEFPALTYSACFDPSPHFKQNNQGDVSHRQLLDESCQNICENKQISSNSIMKDESTILDENMSLRMNINMINSIGSAIKKNTKNKLTLDDYFADTMHEIDGQKNI